MFNAEPLTVQQFMATSLDGTQEIRVRVRIRGSELGGRVKVRVGFGSSGSVHGTQEVAITVKSSSRKP